MTVPPGSGTVGQAKNAYGERPSSGPAHVDLREVRVTLGSSELQVDYVSRRPLSPDEWKGSYYAGWGITFWRPGEAKPVGMVAAAPHIDDTRRLVVAAICGPDDMKLISPITLVPPGVPQSGTSCHPDDVTPTDATATFEGDTLTLVIPRDEIRWLPSKFEWVADIGWTSDSAQAGPNKRNYDFLAFVPAQPDSYEGWMPNRANYPQQDVS